MNTMKLLRLIVLFMLASTMTGCLRFATYGQKQPLRMPYLGAFSPDSSCVAYVVNEDQYCEYRVYYGTPGLFSGIYNLPRMTYWITQNCQIEVHWCDVAHPEKVHKVCLGSRSPYQTVKKMRFAPVGHTLAIQEWDRITFLDLPEGKRWSLRHEGIADFEWLDAEHVTLIVCEDSTGSGRQVDLGVTYKQSIKEPFCMAQRGEEHDIGSYTNLKQAAVSLWANWPKGGGVQSLDLTKRKPYIDPEGWSFQKITDLVYRPLDPDGSDKVLCWDPAILMMSEQNYPCQRTLSPDGHYVIVTGSSAGSLLKKGVGAVLIDLQTLKASPK